jgi:spermidine synthase
MRPWIQLDIANVPGGSVPLRLLQRGDEFSIMIGSNVLMNSRLSGSEEALATLASGALKSRPAPRVLIGGLGMGFTLRAVLGCFDAGAKIVVAEIVPQVVTWARGALAPVFQGCLDDPRVSVVEGDVGRLIKSSKLAYDAILLDVDNGPEGVSRDGNDALYGMAGLSAARAALRPGGVLAVWSAHPSPEFTRVFKATGFAVQEFKVRARSTGKGARHVIWIGTKV